MSTHGRSSRPPRGFTQIPHAARASRQSSLHESTRSSLPCIISRISWSAAKHSAPPSPRGAPERSLSVLNARVVCAFQSRSVAAKSAADPNCDVRGKDSRRSMARKATVRTGDEGCEASGARCATAEERWARRTQLHRRQGRHALQTRTGSRRASSSGAPTAARGLQAPAPPARSALKIKC